jgi:hypothetical protein
MSSSLHLGICNTESNLDFDFDLVLKCDPWLQLRPGMDASCFYINNVCIPQKPASTLITGPWITGTERWTAQYCESMGVMIVRAWAIRSAKLYDDSWHVSRITRARCIESFLRVLPDGWPVVAYII